MLYNIIKTEHIIKHETELRSLSFNPANGVCFQRPRPREQPLKRLNAQIIHISIFLFRLPVKEPKLLQKWLENMGFNAKQISATSKLCSDHFDNIYFIRHGNKTRLKRGSVPTVFGNSKRVRCIYCQALKGVKNGESQRAFYP